VSARGWLARQLVAGDGERLREVIGPRPERMREPTLEEVEQYIYLAELARQAGHERTQLPINEEIAVLVALRERMLDG